MQLCWIPSIQTNYTALYIVMYVGFLAKNIPESWVIYEAVQGILCWNLANEIYWYNKDLSSIWSLNHNFNIVQFFYQKY